MMAWIVLGLALFFLWPFVTWILYLAVMALDRVQESEEGLTAEASALGHVVLAIGLFFDFVTNAVHMSILLFELPREWLVTHRINRHTAGAPGYEARTCLYLRIKLLDRFDRRGIHR